MATDSQQARARAEARFQTAQKRAQEGHEARKDYDANGRAIDEKTTRLKALRLAKEAADSAVAAAEKLAPSSKKPKAKAAKTAKAAKA